MSNLLLPRVTTKQPQGVAAVDKSVSALITPYQTVGRVAKAGTPTVISVSEGTGISFGSGNYFSLPPGSIPDSGGYGNWLSACWSIDISFSIGSTVDQSLFQLGSDASTGYWSFILSVHNGNIELYIGTTITLITSPILNKLYNIRLVYSDFSPYAFKVWVNGSNVHASNGYSLGAATRSVFVGSGFWGPCTTAKILKFAVSTGANVGLSDSYSKGITENPWQIFKSDSRSMLVAPTDPVKPQFFLQRATTKQPLTKSKGIKDGLIWLTNYATDVDYGPTGRIKNILNNSVAISQDTNNYISGVIPAKNSTLAGAYTIINNRNAVDYVMPDTVGLTQMTMLVSFVFDGSLPSAQWLNFRNDTHQTLDIFSRTSSSITWGADWKNTWNGASQQTLSGLTTGDIVTLVAVIDQSGARFFHNGKFSGTKAGSAFTTASAGWTHLVLRGYDPLLCHAWFNRALTDGEARSLSENPWQIFKSQPNAITPPSQEVIPAETLVPTLVFPQKSNKQPVTDKDIDFNNPIIRGLEFLWDARYKDRELIKGKKYDALGGSGGANMPDTYAGQIGTCVRSNTTWNQLKWLTANYKSSADYTVFAYVLDDSGRGNYRNPFDADDSLSNRFFQLRFTTGNVVEFITFIGGTPYIITGSAASSSTQPTLIVGRSSGSTQSVWMDGKLQSSASNGVQNSIGSGLYLCVGQTAYLAGDLQKFSGQNYLCGYFSRALSDTEIVSLSENPWQLFKSQPRTLVSRTPVPTVLKHTRIASIQPATATKVNRSNRFGRNAIVAVNGAVGPANLAGTAPATIVSATPNNYMPEVVNGLKGFRLDPAYSSEITYGQTRVLEGQRGITLVAVVTPVAYGNGDIIAYNGYYDNGITISQGDYEGCRLYARFAATNGTANDSFYAQPAVSHGKTYVLIASVCAGKFVFKRSDLATWTLDGVDSLRSLFTAYPISMGKQQGVAYHANCYMHMAAVIKEGFTESQLDNLLANPWQVFDQSPRLLRVPSIIVGTPQLLVPVSDITKGTWKAYSGPDLYPMLDEVTPDSSDYIYTSTGGDYFEVGLTVGNTPTSSGDYVLSYQLQAGVGSGTIYLKRGATTIASWPYTLTGVEQTISQTLTTGQIASITDYSALRVGGDTN